MRTIFSFGDFYLGVDDVAYHEVNVHLWKFQLQLGSPKPLRGTDGPSEETTHRSQDCSPTQGDQFDSAV
jgi:hypothetical protein